MLERAKEVCKSHEYEDDVIYSLANSHFYVGDYSQAAYNYKIVADRFPSSSFSTGQDTAGEEYAFLKRCGSDLHMDNYRKAEVYELHREFQNAINQYMYVRNSKCQELERRSKKKTKLLQYLQE